MSAPLLELRSASRWYGDVVAVNDISFTAGAGVTGLLGANGAGKTTVLNMAAGLLRPSAGTVQVGGVAPWRNPEVYRTLALVPERETVHPYLTGHGFALASARLYGLRDAEAAARRAIAAVGLEEAQHRRIETYSKGMRQRAKIAGALVQRPQVLLLDEPFNGMDPRQRLLMMDLLRGLADDGCCVLFSSHILEELEQLATNVLVLVAGRLAASGQPREIRRLMTAQPHTLRLRSSDDRALAAALIAEACVLGVELTEAGIMVRASDRGAFARVVAPLAGRSRIRLYELQPTDESLESVFSYLLRS
jgi:ABC-2 type transport system ATP-binding protein